MKKKILFVGHDASQSGAPILLLQFIEWIKQFDKNIEVLILLKRGGRLLNEYKKNGNVIVLNTLTKKDLFHAIINRLGLKKQNRIIKKLQNKYFDFLFFNTVDTLSLMPLLTREDRRNFLYIHELQIAIDLFVKNGNIAQYDKYISQYISVSKAVKYNLINNHNIDESKIKTIYAFPESKKNSKTRHEILNKYNISDDSFIVGNVGRVDLRKGFDFFIRIAKDFLKQNEKAIFIWVGDIPSAFNLYIKKDLEKYGIHERLLFLGQQNNPVDFYQLFDVFLLTSREDPFPLVVLEAAMCKLPVICFDDSGGAKEYIDNGENGFVVPYGDIQTVTLKLSELSNDRSLINKQSEKTNQKIKKYSKNNTFSGIYNIIIKSINKNI